jgi:transcriptional regulator with XRE-family HTH domain
VTRPRPSTSQGEDAGSLTPYDRRRAALGARLRELRRGTDLNQITLAERLGITQSMVSKFETARDIPTAEMVDRFADALALSEDVRGELHDQVAELAIEVNAVRVMQRRGQRWIQAHVGEQERAATTICAFHPSLIPGLLQTRDYTRAVLDVLPPETPDAEDVIAGRQERQSILYDESRAFRFLLTEAVLRTRVAPLAVMRAQLKRLVALDEGFAHIEVAVIPTGAPIHLWAMTGFDILGDLVSVELLTDEILIRDPRDVATYRELFDGLWSSALRGPDMTGLVRRVDRWLGTLAEG